MIVEFALSVLIGIINAAILILSALPAMPTGVTDIIADIIVWFSRINVLLPADTLIQAATIIITLELFFGSWKVTNWIINKIRGSG